MIYVGMVVFGILVGMITEYFESTVRAIREGKLKAVESGHTVVLGWSEGTVKLVCQMALLRQQEHMLNETWVRYFFWWLRVKLSTVVAKGGVVIMCNTMTKAEMEQALHKGFWECGVSRAHTRLGCDVVCRVGDPSDVQALERVGVHRANAVVLQLAQADQDPDVRFVTCYKTVRTLMALRFALYSCLSPPPWDMLRVVVEMNQAEQVVNVARFTAPAPYDDRTIVHAQDMNLFLNRLIFTCMHEVGLSQVQMDLMSFEGASIIFRKVSELHGNGRGFVGCTLQEVGLPWEDAVLLGARSARAPEQDAGLSGILVDRTYKVQASDTLIFLCRTSMPKPALQDTNAEEDDWGRALSTTRGLDRSSSGLMILICGWKSDWDKPVNLLFVLNEISSFAPQGETLSVNFLVEDTPDEFHEHMLKVQALQNTSGRLKRIAGKPTPGEPSWLLEGKTQRLGKVKIAHTEGDAGSFDDLLKVVRAHHYHEAVIIPPTEKRAMRPVLADTWVLSVILALRHGSKELQREPPHIVAESTLEATSKLAVAPSDSQGRPHVPDFVNAPAIKARALCQVIAYPEMSLVLRDLLSQEKGSATVILVSAAAFALGGQTLEFRAVVRRVLKLQPPGGQADDVCMGFRTADGKLRMPPLLSDVHAFDASDKIIIVTRKAPTSMMYEGMMRRRGV
jgi:hypothetical protein